MVTPLKGCLIETRLYILVYYIILYFIIYFFVFLKATRCFRSGLMQVLPQTLTASQQNQIRNGGHSA